jgi:hypothetical protein
MESIEAACPGVTLVWWTAPVMTSGSASRDEFNGLVRAHCASAGCVLFDLADIESHRPDGTAVTDSGYEAMYGPYSDDGGHLASTGRQRAAGALFWLLARIAGWSG